MPSALSLLLAAVLLAACPADPRSVHSAPASAPPALAIRGELLRSGDSLSYSDGEAIRELGSAAGAVPYRVASLGPPVLAVTAGSDLRVTTWGVSSAGEAAPYPDLLPVLASPPLSALAPLTQKPAGGAEGLTLLGANGGALWSHAEADLLWAYAGGDSQTAYVAVSSGGDAIYPYGGAPQLAAIDAALGTELWSIALEPGYDTVDIQLHALTVEHGLLCLQYDYETFEFKVFQRADGALLSRTRLAGQPATRLVYPGPTWEPALALIEGEVATVGVNDKALGLQRWSFNLADGSVDRQPAPDLDVTMREENALALGETPAGSAPPLPQGLLPTAWGENWSIPALVDAGGRVLVLTADSASWR